MIRNKVLAGIFACALAASMPVLAFAADNDSATNGSSTGGSDTGIQQPTDQPKWEDGVENFGFNKASSPDAEAKGLDTYVTRGQVVEGGVPRGVTGKIHVTEGVKIDKFEISDEKAKNFKESDDYVKTATFVIESEDFKTGVDRITVAWQVGSLSEGIKCLVFIEHGDGTTDYTESQVDAKGFASVTLDKLSTITFALTQEEGGTVNPQVLVADNSSKSPKTGVSL